MLLTTRGVRVNTVWRQPTSRLITAHSLPSEVGCAPSSSRGSARGTFTPRTHVRRSGRAPPCPAVTPSGSGCGQKVSGKPGSTESTVTMTVLVRLSPTAAPRGPTARRVEWRKIWRVKALGSRTQSVKEPNLKVPCPGLTFRQQSHTDFVLTRHGIRTDEFCNKSIKNSNNTIKMLLNIWNNIC